MALARGPANFDNEDDDFPFEEAEFLPDDEGPRLEYLVGDDDGDADTSQAPGHPPESPRTLLPKEGVTPQRSSFPTLPTVSADTPTREPAGPIRRLCGKQRDPSSPSVMTASQSGSPLDSVQKRLHAAEDRRQYKRFHNRFYKWAKATVEEHGGTGSDRDRYAQRFDLAKLRPSGKLRVVAEWAQSADPPEELKAWALRFFANMQAKQTQSARKAFFSGRQVMLTFQGSWGRLDNRLKRVPGETDDGYLERTLECLRRDSLVMSLWEDLQELMGTLVQQFRPQTWAVSLELCSETLRSQDTVRVHGHVFVRHASGIRVAEGSTLAWRGSLPHIQDGLDGMTRQRSAAGNSGLYYLLCPKKTVIHQCGSHAPYSQFLVNADWVMNMVQGGKMSYRSARAELVCVAKHVPRNLATLDGWHREMQCLALESLVQSARSSLRRRRVKCDVPEVVRWLRQLCRPTSDASSWCSAERPGWARPSSCTRWWRRRNCMRSTWHRRRRQIYEATRRSVTT